MNRVAMAVALALTAAGPSLAQLELPRQIQVVPVYASPLGIRISWIERAGATYYNVWKSVDGGMDTLFATVSAVRADHPLSRLDTHVDAAHEYTYSVAACNPTTCRQSSPHTTSPRVAWPIAGGHEVLHGYNEVAGWNGSNGNTARGFHMGVDLNKTTAAGVTAGDIVVAPRGGIVKGIAITGVPTDNGAIAIEVDVGGGQFEYDSFNHISTTGDEVPPVMGGDVVAPGQPIARIGTRFPGFWGNFGKHVHYFQERVPIPPGEQRIFRHPLLIFTNAADRDPLGNAPMLFDENQDGKFVLFRDHATGARLNYDFATRPLRGDVDVQAEVVDEQGTDPRQAPIDLGYWIEGPLPESEQHDDVKSAAKPYRLYDFRVEYFGGIPPGPPTPCDAVADIADDANAGCRGLTDCSTQPTVPCNSVIKEGTQPLGWPVLHHFVVTHAKGETGARADVDRNQFWRTAAKDDGEPVGSTHANYAGRDTTTKAWEARFPDGDYVIHVIASDLEHPNVDLTLPVARLENFAPFVKEILVGQDADANPASGQPGLAGCEVVMRHYRHTHRQPYLRPQDLLVSNPTAIARAGQKLCTLIRFSEPVGSVTVDLVRERGAGTPVPGGALTGTLSKTFHTDDTWTGSVTLAPDPSGDSDVSPSGDERDAAIRIRAIDRRDSGGAVRGLDADSDGLPETGGDLSHVVKLDLTRPTGTLDVVKP